MVVPLLHGLLQHTSTGRRQEGESREPRSIIFFLRPSLAIPPGGAVSPRLVSDKWQRALHPLFNLICLSGKVDGDYHLKLGLYLSADIGSVGEAGLQAQKQRDEEEK